MTDGKLRRAIKRVALWHFYANLGVLRRLQQRRRQIPWVLGGRCRKIARCCERPSIRVSPAVWYLRSLRWIFLSWQRHVNGFVRVSSDRAGRSFQFECTHFDWDTRRCDSYDSRPGMCRDYPQALLQQPAPQFFPDCGYRPVALDAARKRRALERAELTPEQRKKLLKELHLED